MVVLGNMSKRALRHVTLCGNLGGMKNVLFICGKARMRSPTAADIISGWSGFKSDFAGLSKDADERVSSEHIAWADIIFVMEQRQKKRLTSLFGPQIGARKVIVLMIPDRFAYGDPVLVARLTPLLERLLGR